jgi:hypothetical protein
MSRILLFSAFWTLLLLGSCMKPFDADFPNQGGLGDDELLWILRIPASPAGVDYSLQREDSLRFQLYNEPFFEQVVADLYQEIMEQEVEAFEVYGSGGVPLTPTRLNEKLRNLDLNKGGFLSFMQTVELFTVVRFSSSRYRPQPRFLRLISTDSTGNRSSQVFAGVYLDSLTSNLNSLTINNESISIVDFLTSEAYFFTPFYLRTNRQEYVVRSLAEARYLKKVVKEGQWVDLDWIEGEINISGKSRMETDPANILDYAGTYRFPPQDSLGDSLELFLTPEKDYLIADWKHRFALERIFPWEQDHFFSCGGDYYIFQPDSALSYIHEDDTLTWEK